MVLHTPDNWTLIFSHWFSFCLSCSRKPVFLILSCSVRFLVVSSIYKCIIVPGWHHTLQLELYLALDDVSHLGASFYLCPCFSLADVGSTA